VIREPSYKADQDKNKKLLGKPQLATRDTIRDRGRPELHNDALNRVTTQCAAVIETEKIKGFHPEPYMEKVPTTTSSRG
jgi:hypothetical protein